MPITHVVVDLEAEAAWDLLSPLVPRRLEPRVHQRVEDEVGERERDRHRQRRAGRVADRGRIGEVGVDLREQGAGLREHVPAVPPLDPPEEDAGADEHEHAEDARPADRVAEAVTDDRVYEVERDEPEQNARPREGQTASMPSNQSGGLRHSARWTKSVTMYGAFGRKSSQSASAGTRRASGVPAAVAVVDDQGEHERDPGEEQGSRAGTGSPARRTGSRG